MKSEKVKEIKKALEENANYEHYDKLGYIDGYKCKTVAYADILTYINELESENERLRLERDVLIGKKIVEKQKYDKALIMKIDIQEQLKNRIAELEIENKSLQDLCNKTYEDLTKEIDRLEKENKIVKEMLSKYGVCIITDADSITGVDNIDETLKEFIND